MFVCCVTCVHRVHWQCVIISIFSILQLNTVNFYAKFLPVSPGFARFRRYDAPATAASATHSHNSRYRHCPPVFINAVFIACTDQLTWTSRAYALEPLSNHTRYWGLRGVCLSKRRKQLAYPWQDFSDARMWLHAVADWVSVTSTFVSKRLKIRP